MSIMGAYKFTNVTICLFTYNMFSSKIQIKLPTGCSSSYKKWK